MSRLNNSQNIPLLKEQRSRQKSYQQLLSDRLLKTSIMFLDRLKGHNLHRLNFSQM
jgi:hypothetical protein